MRITPPDSEPTPYPPVCIVAGKNYREMSDLTEKEIAEISEEFLSVVKRGKPICMDDYCARFLFLRWFRRPDQHKIINRVISKAWTAKHLLFILKYQGDELPRTLVTPVALWAMSPQVREANFAYWKATLRELTVNAELEFGL